MSSQNSVTLTPRDDQPERNPSKNVSVGHGDRFDMLPLVRPRSVHLVIADLPYQVTACPWDHKIDLGRYWTEVRRIVTLT